MFCSGVQSRDVKGLLPRSFGKLRVVKLAQRRRHNWIESAVSLWIISTDPEAGFTLPIASERRCRSGRRNSPPKRKPLGFGREITRAVPARTRSFLAPGDAALPPLLRTPGSHQQSPAVRSLESSLLRKGPSSQPLGRHLDTFPTALPRTRAGAEPHRSQSAQDPAIDSRTPEGLLWRSNRALLPSQDARGPSHFCQMELA